MNTSTKTTAGLSAAIAAAALFLAAPIAQATDHAAGASAMGHCMGANACKGQGACKGTSNSCKGQNACKGQGFTMATAEQCKTANGRFEAPKAEKAEPAKPQAQG